MAFDNETINGQQTWALNELAQSEEAPPCLETDIVEWQVAEGADERRQRVESEMQRDAVFYGNVWTPQQRDILFAERMKFLEDLDRLHFASLELHRMETEDRLMQRGVEDERHQELAETIERGNVVAQAVDFAMAHPFLTGLFGPSILKGLMR